MVKRVVKAGIDGISRGEVGEGIMKGKEIISFFLFHLNTLERSERNFVRIKQ